MQFSAHELSPAQTYGPFTRNYDQPAWVSLSLTERARLMARQGQAFATAQGVRVVFPFSDNEEKPALHDVPRDGKTVGEIITKGNILMKEVSLPMILLTVSYRASHYSPVFP